MKRALALAGIALVASCGGQQGTLTVDIVVPVGDDPFADAASVHVQLGSPAVAAADATVTAGHFSASFNLSPPSGTAIDGAVEVDALDSSGAVIGRGRTPVLGLLPDDEEVAVFVGRVGHAGVAPATLTRARSDLAAAPLPRLGAAFVGGTDSGMAVGDTDVYDEYSHTISAGTPLAPVRTAATAVGFDRPDDDTGAILLIGGASAELGQFDPLEGTTGTWSTLATDASLERSGANVALLSDGSLLVSGGLDASSQPLATASVVIPPASASVSVTSLGSAMLATPRAGHTASPFTSSQGAALLLFGGAASGPAAEVYLEAAHTFTPQDLGSQVASRTDHTATVLSDGRIVIAGGTDGSAPALASGIVLTPPALSAQVVPNLLPTARAGHVAVLDGNKLLLCGGVDATGAPLASCDLLDATTLQPVGSITLAVARTHTRAIPIDTGNLLLVGGETANGPSTTIEVYTPSQ